MGAVVTIVGGFIDGDADDVLGSLGIDILREHALVMDHFPSAGGDGKFYFALFCGGFRGTFLVFLGGLAFFIGFIRLFGGVFGGFFRLFGLVGGIFGVANKGGVFPAGLKITVEITFLGFFKLLFDAREALLTHF